MRTLVVPPHGFTDGQIVWRTYVGGEIKGTPLLFEGIVYVTSWAGKLHALDIRDGHFLWETELGGLSQSSPTLIPETNLIIVASSRGQICAIDRRDGHKVWEQTHVDAIVGSALAAADVNGKWWAWLACGHNELCAFDPRTGKIAQRLSLPGQLTGVPVGYDNSLYLSLNFPGGLIKLSGF